MIGKNLKISRKKFEEAPDYIEVDGVPYEKIDPTWQSVELDLAESQLNNIKRLAKEAGLQNWQQWVRDAIKDIIPHSPSHR